MQRDLPTKTEILDLMFQQKTQLSIPWEGKGYTPEEFYNTILHPSIRGTICPNQIKSIGAPALDVWMQDHHDIGLLEVTFLYCRWRGIRPCQSPDSRRFIHAMEAFAPKCDTWVGFRKWAVQLAACVCQDKHPDMDHDPLHYVVTELDLLFNTLLDPPSKDRLNKQKRHSWLGGSVDLVEVSEVIEWLCRTSSIVRDPRIPAPPPEYVELTHGRVLEAMNRARTLGLCPRRVWGITTNMQRGKLNLPTLIPPPGTSVTPHVGHDDCTSDFCQESTMSFTSVRQLHVCGTPPFCQHSQEPLPPFPEELLHDAAINRRPTAWTFDGTEIVKPGRPFMAISHVWADGTGNGRGEFNRCLYKRFCDIAASLGCEGIWWDAICLPNERVARTAAINNMNNNYKTAKLTLVHDLYIQKYKWIDEDSTCADGACFAVIMSSWWTRGWTALELSYSGTVKILFADLVIKDLDADILAKPRKPSSPSRQVSTTAIRGLRVRVEYIDHLLTTLGPRYTSFGKDKGVIAAILTGIEIQESLPRQQVYQKIIEELAYVTADNLFHGKETMVERAFNWCPTDILEMPVSRTPDATGHLRFVAWEAKGLRGSWDICSLGYLKENATFIWKGVPPLLQAKLQRALKHDDEYVLLVEFIRPQPRGIVVKPMIGKGAYNEIGAQFIGTVDFVWSTDDGWNKEVSRDGMLGRYMITIGDTKEMKCLPPGTSAYEYLYSLWPRNALRKIVGEEVTGVDETRVGGLEMGPQEWWRYVLSP